MLFCQALWIHVDLENAEIEASQTAKSKFKSYEDDSHDVMIS